MKTRFSRRPFAAVALAIAMVLPTGAFAASAAATSSRHTARPAVRAEAPSLTSAAGRWVRQLLSVVGLLPPPPSSTPGTTSKAPLPAPTDDNGAGIDPNG